MAKKKGIGVNSVILVLVVVLVVGLSLGVFYKAPVESGEGELGTFMPEMPGAGDSFCKGNPNPIPCFTSKTKFKCCPRSKPYCTFNVAGETECKTNEHDKDDRPRDNICVKQNKEGIKCGRECCQGLCFSFPKGRSGLLSYELCCLPGTYPFKNQGGLYECKSICEANEKYNEKTKKCEGEEKPCQNVEQECGEMKECCPNVDAPGKDYDKHPMRCSGGICLGSCIYNRVKPVTCGNWFGEISNEKLILWCCEKNEVCGNNANECKSNGCENKDEILCGDICCDISDGPDTDKLPDNVCKFYPGGPSGTYKCQNRDDIDIKPCDQKSEDCKSEGNYYCRTDSATNECKDGYDKCCWNQEICVEDENIEYSCFEPGSEICMKDGKYSFGCTGGTKCCGNTCCLSDETCLTNEEGEKYCEENIV